MHPELTRAWRDVRAELRRTVGESTYDIWLAPLQPKEWDGTVLLLEAPPDVQAWVADRYGRVLERCVRAVLGASVRVTFTGEDDGHSPLAIPTDPAFALERFIPRYTFDQYIIGDGNRLAHAAALAVAESPAQAYNPLFLHAPPGLGKTHLLHAIGNYIASFDPTTTVRYTTVEAFTNGFIAALNAKGLEQFKHLYRNVDVLLIDDVQFLDSKVKTEEEFFHTFNAIYDSGRQLVLTSDRLPQKLTGLAERLRARFESGLVAHLTPPDRRTRIAILRKRAALDGLHVTDPAVLDLIADRVTDNIRSLEGALIRIVAHHSLTGHPIDTELATVVLNEIHPGTASVTQLSVGRIQDVVADYFHLTPDDLTSASRQARIVWSRQLAIHLTREFTDDSLKEVGQAFGGRNHATVLHACKRVSDRITRSVEDAADLAALRAILTPERADRSC